MYLIQALLLGFLISGLLVAPATHAETSWLAPLAGHSLLLDITREGDVLYAVGARGQILRFDKETGWRQQSAPTQVLLTAVDFYDNHHGCAVGHDSVIVCTRDGGRRWSLVYAAVDLQAPLLDILFLSADEVIAIGAYSLYLESSDGGRTWQRRVFAPATMTGIDGFKPHLNSITTAGDHLLIVAEAGHVYESKDRGRHWQQRPSPYHGSWFVALAAPGHGEYIAGLRGHLYRSGPAPLWRSLPTMTHELLTDGLLLASGEQIFIGHGGIVLYRVSINTAFKQWRHPQGLALQALVQGPDQSLVLVTDRGLRTLELDELREHAHLSANSTP